MFSVKKCTCCKEYKCKKLFGKKKANISGLDSWCKKCYAEKMDKKRKTKRGVLRKIYDSQIGSSKSRGYALPRYDFNEFLEWALSKEEFHIIFKIWKESGYEKNLVPSVDRLDDYKSYTISNIRIINWKENNDKGNSDRINGINNKQSKSIIQLSKDRLFIAEYYSIHEAERQTKIPNQNIVKVCKNKRKTAGGYIWKYKEQS